MAYLYKDLQGILASQFCSSVTFFLHRRGTDLQKTFKGLLRSLLYQIYRLYPLTRPKVLTAFEEKKIFGEVGKAWDWQVSELQNLLSSAISSITWQMVIFVDALDEAGEDARNIADYFHRLNDLAKQRSLPIRICMSCRHYPIVAARESLEIWVEKYNDNDIAAYVRNRLRSGIEDKESLENLEEDIINKAMGIFQWVCLVVPRVITWYIKGKSLKDIHTLLAKVPSDLKGVYQYIIEKTISHRSWAKSLHLMQWIYFAERPLSLTELRYALVAEKCSSAWPRCEDVPDFVESDARMEKQITSLSGGLAEVKHNVSDVDTYDSDASEFATSESDTSESDIPESDTSDPTMCHSTVQFIHQSVNDYLLHGGLKLLNALSEHIDSRDTEQRSGVPTGQLVGRSHSRLVKACLSYLNWEVAAQLDLIEEIEKKYEETRTKYGGMMWPKRRRIQILQNLPVLLYVTRFCFRHMKKAESHGVFQDYVIQELRSSGKAFRGWLAVYRGLNDQHTIPILEIGSKLIHVASQFDVRTIVQALLRNGTFMDERDDQRNTALIHAARGGFTKLFDILVDAGANIETKNKSQRTPLAEAAENGQKQIVATLLSLKVQVNESTGYTGNALQSAVHSGPRDLAQMLISSGAEVNAQGGKFGNALQRACFNKDKDVVQLLLEEGADVNAQGGFHGNALQAACYGGNLAAIELLLENGAEINAQGGYCNNALQAAFYCGNRAVLKLLLKKGAEVNRQGGTCGNALQLACQDRPQDIVELLLEGGAEVNAQGGWYGNALQAACVHGRQAVAELLLKKGAKVNAQGGEYENALQAACLGGYRDLVQLLLDKGAEVNAQSSKYGSALQTACCGGNQDVVELLLENGAEINARGGEQGSAVQIATWKGHKAIVHLLLGDGASAEDVSDSEFGQDVSDSEIDHGTLDIPGNLQFK